MRHALTLRALGQHPTMLAAGVLAIGALAVFLAGPRDRATAPAASAPVGHGPLMVLAASHALSAGSILGPRDVEAVPSAGRAPVGAALSRSEVLGRVLAKPYAAKERFSRGDLRDVSAVGIAARVPRGQRAFSIRVFEDDIVGGFLQSGDRVDLFATIPGSVFPSKDTNGSAGRSRTVLLLQDVPVLAVGENPATRGSVQTGARTVSLSLTPEGLARLALAERFGKVSLAIRNPGDGVAAPAVSATLADLVPSAVPGNTVTQAKRKGSSGIPFYSGVHTTALSRGGSR